MAILAPFLANHDPHEIDLQNKFQPPNREYYFGTDSVGQDIYSRILYGSRLALQTGITVLATAGSIGLIIGVIAGYFRGKIEEVIMRITDIFFAIPSLILAMAVSAALGERSLTVTLVALSVVWWPFYTRTVRGVTMSLRENQYIEASKCIGANDWRIIFDHILPNTLGVIIVQASMDMGNVILTAAALSFIGFGAGPGEAEWGRMIADGRFYIQTYPWMTIFPGLAIFFAVLGFALLGDGLRDILDPRLRW